MTIITEADILALDFESTGLSTENDQIVECGITIFKQGKPVSRGRKLVRPDVPIADEARAVHRISNERVADCPSFGDLLPRLIKSFEKTELVVTYNGLFFDIPLLNAEAKRAGSDWRVPMEKILDVFVFVGWHHRGERHRKQEIIGPKFYDVQPQEGAAHSAAVDTQMTGEILFGMIKNNIIADNIEAALAEQARLQPIIAKEFEEWGVWLYRDRSTRRLRLGAGKNCGKLLVDVPKTFYNWALNNVDDLPTPAKKAFEAARDGRTQDEIQESMFADEERTEKMETDDVEGWGG
jgi:DNA polymerase-3 subunit epsilon